MNANTTNLGEDFYVKKSAANLSSAGDWIIQNAHFVLKNKGEASLRQHLFDVSRVQLWVQPQLDDRYIALFRIKARGIHHNIQCLMRISLGKVIYEYWIKKIHSENWAGIKNNTFFVITKADYIAAHREILMQSDQYIEAYKIDEKNVLKLPIENLQLLYDMEVWNFPENYKNANISKKRVVAAPAGQFLVEK